MQAKTIKRPISGPSQISTDGFICPYCHSIEGEYPEDFGHGRKFTELDTVGTATHKCSCCGGSYQVIMARTMTIHTYGVEEGDGKTENIR